MQLVTVMYFVFKPKCTEISLFIKYTKIYCTTSTRCKIPYFRDGFAKRFSHNLGFRTRTYAIFCYL